jgi:hypothetical protein
MVSSSIVPVWFRAYGIAYRDWTWRRAEITKSFIITQNFLERRNGTQYRRRSLL